MERAEGSPQPDDFHSNPDEAYPSYDVLAAMTDATAVRICRSTDPGRVDALALNTGILLIANPTSAEQVVEVEHRSVTVGPFSVARLAIPGKDHP